MEDDGKKYEVNERGERFEIIEVPATNREFKTSGPLPFFDYTAPHRHDGYHCVYGQQGPKFLIQIALWEQTERNDWHVERTSDLLHDVVTYRAWHMISGRYGPDGYVVERRVVLAGIQMRTEAYSFEWSLAQARNAVKTAIERVRSTE